MPETMSPREKVADIVRGGMNRLAASQVGARPVVSLSKEADRVTDAILAALASSIDHAGLKRLADEAADFGVPAKVDPSVLNALIAEVAALRGERDAMTDNYDRATRLHASTCRDLTEAERKLAEADGALELAAIRFDEIYEAAEVDDVAYRNEATIHGINGLADVAQSEIRTFLSKEAERG